MISVYLDQNIYIKCMEGSIDKETLIGYRESKGIQFVYAPPHIEEIYRVASSVYSPYKDKMPDLIQMIKEITNSKEVLPTLNGLHTVTEPPENCYHRVKGIDTTQRIEHDSLLKYGIDTENYVKMLREDKSNRSIPNLSSTEIWNNGGVKAVINNLNENCHRIVNNYNNSMEVQMFLLCGLDRRLPDDFCIAKDTYAKRLKKSFNELEFLIELLMRVLNYCGYNAEKTEKTAVSSTHDVTHCIYGTECDYLITLDKRFSKKCEAVYKFIGANTRVIYCKAPNEVLDAIGRLT